MSETVIACLVSFVGTCVGTLGGILASSRLTNYRIEQLERKVEAHNQLIDRTYKLERETAVIKEEINEIKERM